MKKTFDREASRWLENEKNSLDYNIQPPGYDSVKKNEYMISELEAFIISAGGKPSGGIFVTISGKSYGRIDRIFIHPDHQGKGIGSKAIKLIEERYPNVRIWHLETSAKQISNHYFYEKMGYSKTFESLEEYSYEKLIEVKLDDQKLLKNEDLSHRIYEHCSLSHSEYYGVNMEESSVSNSNLKGIHVSNCNMSEVKFQNINLTHSLIADLNLSKSEFAHLSLSGVTFTNTDLGEEGEPVSFEGCNLQGSKFINCDLKGIEISDSDLSGMKINDIPVKDLLDAYKRVSNT
ncbi:GNAT family N-acetyltransferase [Rossellomorea aquimaris]|uniref:GNAT family N-acetyltransferase n=1 Tax=Rossellomorea aquimaris TaxID=189382 RepID=A0A1J6WXP7_9BACI|nr:GNAT family N-acetyltransferase [Rossellomorea aquimaris]OIU72623.1 GNAT family N-acetyltransferase [Rossellomorea aquimaris]